jgi:hypothetical protein
MPFLTKAHSSLAQNTFRTTENDWASDRYAPSQYLAGISEIGMNASSASAPSRRLCGSPECSNGWRAPWRNRQRPVFEEQWGCSGRCVLAMVRTAASRELGNDMDFASIAPHRHRVPLGLLMLAQGWITHPQLRLALEAQRESGTGKIGQWLVEKCGIDQEQITRALGMQWGCPVLSTDGFSPDAMALVTPRLFVDIFGLVPIRVAGLKILYLGFADRPDASVALAMEKMTDLRVVSGVVSGTQHELARRRLLACDQVEVKVEAAEDREEMVARITAIIEQKQPIASRLVRMHEYYWLRLWLEKGTFGKTGTIPNTGEDVKDYIFTARA